MKLKELIIHIASESIDDVHFGSIKMNKILFYSDLFAFGILGKPITDSTYLRRPLGPAPKNIKALLNEMETIDKSITLEIRPVDEGAQKRTIALRNAHTEVFSKEELDLAKQVIEMFKSANGPQTSRFSHDFRWETANEDEVIPLETVFLKPRPLTLKEIKHGLSLTSSKGV